MNDRKSFELSAAAVAVTAAAVITACAAAATGYVLHKLVRLRVMFEKDHGEAPMSFEEEPTHVEVETEE